MAKDIFVNLENARHQDQREVMEGIAQRQECPFCRGNLHITHQQPILREGKHWIVTPNQWPYDHTRLHLLAISTEHVSKISELDRGAGDELFAHYAWAEKKYAIRAGGIAMRSGDISLSGATVDHLHSHIIVPKDNLGEGQKVRFKIS